MNPSSSETPPMQLPAPVMEQAPSGVKTDASAAEKAPAGPERAPNSGTGAPAASLSPIPLPATPALPAMPAQNAAPTAATPVSPITDDGDLIEKEWVNKAKQIVEHNRDDPYKQSEEMTVFKADYMKKRYGKTIKISK